MEERALVEMQRFEEKNQVWKPISKADAISPEQEEMRNKVHELTWNIEKVPMR